MLRHHYQARKAQCDGFLFGTYTAQPSYTLQNSHQDSNNTLFILTKQPIFSYSSAILLKVRNLAKRGLILYDMTERESFVLFAATHSHDLPIRNVTQNFKCLIVLCSLYSLYNFFQFLASGLSFSEFLTRGISILNFSFLVGRGGLWWLVAEPGGLWWLVCFRF